MPLRKNIQKNTALFCLLIYVLFSFLSNAGAILCFGTEQNRHVGIHALNYDSCADSSVSIKANGLHSSFQNKFDYSTFQIELNKAPLMTFAKTISKPPTSDFCKNFRLYQIKQDKTNWEIYKELLSFRYLSELKTIILVI